MAAVEFGYRDRGEKHSLGIEVATISELDERDIAHGWTRGHEIATCTPPVRNSETFDREVHWNELQEERFEQIPAASGPLIWRDSAGAGKTTNAARGAANRDLQHALVFATHEKAREHLCDDTTPDGYIHLKGKGQPLHDCCLDASIASDGNQKAQCPKHGTEDSWPRMCPLFELDENHPKLARYEALAAVVGAQKAHKNFCSGCPWLEQYGQLDDAQRVVGVHEHQQRLDGKGFTVIVDETPRLPGDEQKWTAGDLRRAGNLLRSLDTEHAQAVGEFVRSDLLDAVVDGTLDGLTAPPIDSGDLAETVVKIKIAYNERLLAQIELDIWNGEPACIDAIIAILAELGFSSTACREAIAGPSTLLNCPHCGAPTTTHNSVIECENTECFWGDGRFDILPYWNRERARAIAYLETDDAPTVSENGLCFLSLPDPRELPDSLLILDATATPKKIAGIYGVPLESIAVEGDKAYELNANVFQIRDGAYHPGTISSAFGDERRNLDDRLQQKIDVIADQHERPLFISKRSVLYQFDFPNNAETRHYGGLRGLNLQECDAVICIGAPHPNIENILHQARLLAMDYPGLEVGGEEHGNRNGVPNPPIYRKLYYSDIDGQGRAVPTKHFDGLVGDLFYEAREKEIEQAVHRIRPLLAEETKDIYLLTNVPTTLPIDEFVELDAISDEPLAAHIPVPGDVIPHLLEPLADLATDDDYHDIEVTESTITAHSSGLHALAREAGADWSEATRWRRMKKLVELGLVTEGQYEDSQGYRYMVDRAALSRILLVTSSTSEKVEAVSRFRAKTRNADGSLDWLDWAYQEFVDSNAES